MNRNNLPIKAENETDLWHKLIGILSAVQPTKLQLSKTELEILTYICTTDLDQTPFCGTAFKRLQENFPNINEMSLRNHASRIKKKGWMKDNRIRESYRNILKNIKETIIKRDVPKIDIATIGFNIYYSHDTD